MPKTVRYAVVGLGHIAQAAILPAFRHARGNSTLAAVVSGDAAKRREVSKRYKVPQAFTYEQYDECLQQVDAVFIALPNSLHADYAIRAARAGVHVLCEKPLAVTAAECRRMRHAAERHRVKLMTAYRLHFEQLNLTVIDLVQRGQIGEPRLFTSTFTMTVRTGDIRTKEKLGGGTLYDIGVYCINAARNIFRAEPTSVWATSVTRETGRLKEIDETTTAVLRFGDDRIATFTTSFDSASVSSYRVVGTKGMVHADPAYGYATGLAYQLTRGEKTERFTVPKRDQFAAELLYFSDCILKDREPEPSGLEGELDVRIVEALYRSARTGRIVKLRPAQKRRRATKQQRITRPGVRKPPLTKVQSASVKTR